MNAAFYMADARVNHPSSAARLLAHGRYRPKAELRQPSVALVAFSERSAAEPSLRDPRLKETARREGWLFDVFHLPEFRSPAELSRTLGARGVQGVIFHTSDAPPNIRLSDLDGFEWDRFTIIKISRGFDELPCHTVAVNVFHETRVVLENVLAAGYRRLFVLLVAVTASEEDDWLRRAAIEVFRECRADRFEAMEIFATPAIGSSLPDGLQSRLSDFRPDVVMGFPFAWRFLLEAHGYRIPDDFAFVTLLAPRNDPADRERPTTGPICDFIEQEFTVALRILEDELAAGRRGLPRYPFEHAVRLDWRLGVTMPCPAPHVHSARHRTAGLTADERAVARTTDAGSRSNADRRDRTGRSPRFRSSSR